jgi:hypothetical protein
MVIEEGSPFRQLPAALNRKQVLFLDGILYSVEMSDLAHLRLQRVLLERTQRQAEEEPIEHQLMSAAFQDAWTIVDSLHRLRGLLAQMPGVKQNSPPLQVFRRQTAIFEDLRNGVQHLNNHIDLLVAQNLPTWGVLSWVAFLDPTAREFRVGAMMAGTVFVGASLPMVNPMGREVAPPIDLITLTAHGHQVNLSAAMTRVEQLVRRMESELRAQFKAPPQPPDELQVRLRLSEPTQR